MPSERDRLIDIMQARKIEGRLRSLYFVSDLSTPEKVDAMWQRTTEGYNFVTVAKMPNGEFIPFFSPFGSHSELDETIQAHYQELGLKEKPTRVIGAQFDISPYDTYDRLAFSYPMSARQGERPYEEEVVDAALATLRKVDPSRYSDKRTLMIESIGMDGIYRYRGGSTLIPPTRR